MPLHPHCRLSNWQDYASFAHLGRQLASRRRRQPNVRTDPLGLGIGM